MTNEEIFIFLSSVKLGAKPNLTSEQRRFFADWFISLPVAEAKQIHSILYEHNKDFLPIRKGE